MVGKPYKLAVFIILILISNMSNSQYDEDFYRQYFSSFHFDKIRKMEYWSRASLSIRDFNRESGDAAYLKLCSKDPNNHTNIKTNDEVALHFTKEFKRLVQGKIPYHDILKGQSKRFKDFMAEHGGKPDSYDKFEAYEEARNKALYGSHHGTIYCIIEINRRKFPILYVMHSKIWTDDRNYFSAELEEKTLGYSSPEHIVDELKRAITEHSEALGKKLSMVRSIKK